MHNSVVMLTTSEKDRGRWREERAVTKYTEREREESIAVSPFKRGHRKTVMKEEKMKKKKKVKQQQSKELMRTHRPAGCLGNSVQR